MGTSLSCFQSMPAFYHAGLFLAEGAIEKSPQLD
jgi:hypothetical protein